jgi:hypothetical protein
VQPIQRRDPPGPAQLASPVHHITFTEGAQLRPVGGEQLVPGGVQGAGDPFHDIVAAQDSQDPFVMGGPQGQAPGDLAPRVRQRRRADRGQVVLDALGQAARRRRGEAGPPRAAVQREHRIEVGGGAELLIDGQQPG